MLEFALRNGVRMPGLGLGTYQSQGNDVATAVCAALQAGIRHIDTAHVYRNEELVAEGIRKSGVAREDIFLVSKLGPSQQGKQAAREGAETMLAKLGKPVDLALIHWPGAAGTNPASDDNARLRQETWSVLEEFYEKGLFKAIGVSNFEIPHLKQLAEVAKVPVMVNQIEVHPFWPNTELVSYCQSQGIIVTAYSPLGRGLLIDNPVVKAVSQTEGKTPSQVLVRWGQQKGCVSIPKSVKAERIAELAELVDPKWSLSPESMSKLDSLAEEGKKLCWDPQAIV